DQALLVGLVAHGDAAQVDHDVDGAASAGRPPLVADRDDLAGGRTEAHHLRVDAATAADPEDATVLELAHHAGTTDRLGDGGLADTGRRDRSEAPGRVDD